MGTDGTRRGVTHQDQGYGRSRIDFPLTHLASQKRLGETSARARDGDMPSKFTRPRRPSHRERKLEKGTGKLEKGTGLQSSVRRVPNRSITRSSRSERSSRRARAARGESSPSIRLAEPLRQKPLPTLRGRRRTSGRSLPMTRPAIRCTPPTTSRRQPRHSTRRDAREKCSPVTAFSRRQTTSREDGDRPSEFSRTLRGRR